MNRFFTLLLAASCLTAVGQVTYPYNPDGNADGDIAVGDLQDFLTVFGNQFEPGIILVDSIELSYLIDSLFQRIFTLEQQQQQTLELFGCGVPHACNYSHTVPVQVFELCQFPEAGHDCEGNFVGYRIGDFAFDGIVYTTWNNGINGRVVSLVDLGTQNWGCTNDEISNGFGEGYGYGNTLQILENCPSPNIATMATELGEGWYVPSQGDLFNALETLSPHVQQSYWSSAIDEGVWGTNSERMLASFQESIGWEHFETDWYWSSSDNYPWGGSAVKVENSGNVEGSHWLEKTEYHFVRAVKDF